MLTGAECKNAICPPDKKQARFADSGGTYLQVSPAGSGGWRWEIWHRGGPRKGGNAKVRPSRNGSLGANPQVQNIRLQIQYCSV